MSGFITKSACRGKRPAPLSSYAGFQRPELISLLLRERLVPRFVVAPEGYGKTSLVAEYAETALLWAHTFWINAKSPCFLRDLDEGTIAGDCHAVDETLRLVVFDDVPALDGDRAARFSAEIDSLLGLGAEVIVVTTPACDVFGGLQIDRFRIGARDLLLNDEELDSVRPADERARIPSSKLPPSRRVAAFHWHDAGRDDTRFVRNALKERLPADMMAFTVCALALQKGTLRDLAPIASFSPQAVAEFAADYPHLGYDGDLGQFDCQPFEVESLAPAFKDAFDQVAGHTACPTRETLATALADILASRGECGRACDLVRLVCPHVARAAWLSSHAAELVRSGCFFGTWQLARAVGQRYDDPTPDDAAVRNAVEAVCRFVLGDPEGAAKAAKRVAFGDSRCVPAVATGCYVLVRCANATLGKRAQAALASMAAGAPEPWNVLAQAWALGGGADVEAVLPEAVLPEGGILGGDAASGEAPSHEGPARHRAGDLPEAPAPSGGDDAAARVAGLADLWEQASAAGMSEDVLCLVASRLFAVAGQDVPATGLPAAERYVRERIDAAGAALSHFVLSAGLSLEAAHMAGMPLSAGPLKTAALVALRRGEMAVMAQRRLFEQELDAWQARQDSWAVTHPDALSRSMAASASQAPKRAVPMLSLKLFGRFEVMIGDELVDQKHFRRQHVRSLLVLLAVNQGKEISRESIVNALWPNSAASLGRKNFYTIWSMLKHALSLPDGTCPYLIRHQYGCSLNERYVRSDIERLNEICRDLMFGQPDRVPWADLSLELERDFSADLMPAVNEGDLMAEARAEYRSRLVDALVAAAINIVDGGNPQWAVWFAREALGHDDTREDAYVALMRAQIARHQRTSAMMTYLKCQRVLGERLGVDPSPETKSLYQDLLDAL